MNTDLTMLTASAILTALLVNGKGIAMWKHWSVSDVLGNRENPPSLPEWAWRADRAHHNMLENFPHFAAFVLIVNVSGLANQQTALGAVIFFWARLAHAVLYIAGIWKLPGIAFFTAWGGRVVDHLPPASPLVRPSEAASKSQDNRAKGCRRHRSWTRPWGSCSSSS